MNVYERVRSIALSRNQISPILGVRFLKKKITSFFREYTYLTNALLRFVFVMQIETDRSVGQFSAERWLKREG